MILMSEFVTDKKDICLKFGNFDVDFECYGMVISLRGWKNTKTMKWFV